MHYKNGRPVELGDFVIGVSHNSKRPILAVVLEQMPKQGPCNIRVRELRLTTEEHAKSSEVASLTMPLKDTPLMAVVAGNFDDYGDAAEFIRIEDGLRMAKALKLAAWDCPYLV